MTTLKCFAFAAALVASAAPAHAAEYSGLVKYVEDGDTFTVDAGSTNVKVRLCGIDSPERASKKRPEARERYQKAKDALGALIHEKTVRCVQVGANAGTPCDRRSKPTNRDRIVAQCFVGKLDIATEMVRSGNACAWPKFSNDYYNLDSDTCIRH